MSQSVLITKIKNEGNKQRVIKLKKIEQVLTDLRSQIQNLESQVKEPHQQPNYVNKMIRNKERAIEKVKKWIGHYSFKLF